MSKGSTWHARGTSMLLFMGAISFNLDFILMNKTSFQMYTPKKLLFSNVGQCLCILAQVSWQDVKHPISRFNHFIFT